MKTSILFFLIIGLALCRAQEFNKEINTPQGHQFLVGQITIEGLQNEPYKTWFEASYNQYTIDKSLVDMIDKKLKDHEIKLFLGTWCGDSKRETPRIIKILKEANFPMDDLEIIALDRRKEYYKKSPEGEEKGLNIIKVPTLIFFKDGKEVNRIVESPLASLEEDMLSILSAGPYIPNYSK